MICPADLQKCEQEFDCADRGCRKERDGEAKKDAAHRGGYSGEEQE